MSNIYYYDLIVCYMCYYINLYLNKILLDQSVMINKFKAWHVDLIEKVQKITGLSNYQIIWISFAEGLIIGFLICYFI